MAADLVIKGFENPFDVFDALGLIPSPYYCPGAITVAWRKASRKIHPDNARLNKGLVPQFPNLGELDRAKEWLLEAHPTNLIAAYRALRYIYRSTWNPDEPEGTAAVLRPMPDARAEKPPAPREEVPEKGTPKPLSPSPVPPTSHSRPGKRNSNSDGVRTEECLRCGVFGRRHRFCDEPNDIVEVRHKLHPSNPGVRWNPFSREPFSDPIERVEKVEFRAHPAAEPKVKPVVPQKEWWIGARGENNSLQCLKQGHGLDFLQYLDSVRSIAGPRGNRDSGRHLK